MKKALLFSVTMIAALPVLAAGAMKPGLWAMTTESAAMQNMPKLSAEQIAQMKKMGVDVSQFQNNAITTNTCITKEMAETTTVPQSVQEQSGCKAVNTTQSGSTYTVDTVCEGKDIKGKGRAKSTFSGNDGFVTQSDFKGTMQGMPINESAKITGKWLSSDCGTVKPVAIPR